MKFIRCIGIGFIKLILIPVYILVGALVLIAVWGGCKENELGLLNKFLDWFVGFDE